MVGNDWPRAEQNPAYRPSVNPAPRDFFITPQPKFPSGSEYVCRCPSTVAEQSSPLRRGTQPATGTQQVPHLAEGNSAHNGNVTSSPLRRGARRAGWFITSNESRVTTTPCHCEGVRSTLKTLSYDCGNLVQYVCGHSPAVLFYLLDRHGRFTPSR